MSDTYCNHKRKKSKALKLFQWSGLNATIRVLGISVLHTRKIAGALVFLTNNVWLRGNRAHQQILEIRTNHVAPRQRCKTVQIAEILSVVICGVEMHDAFKEMFSVQNLHHCATLLKCNMAHSNAEDFLVNRIVNAT